jgi:hypothetical protein
LGAESLDRQSWLLKPASPHEVPAPARGASGGLRPSSKAPKKFRARNFLLAEHNRTIGKLESTARPARDETRLSAALLWCGDIPFG